MSAEMPEASYSLDLSFSPLFLRDAYHGHECFSPRHVSPPSLVPYPKWTEGQQIRHKGQRCVAEQARKHEVIQASRIKEVLVSKVMSGLDKPIRAQFGGGAVA